MINGICCWDVVDLWAFLCYNSEGYIYFSFDMGRDFNIGRDSERDGVRKEHTGESGSNSKSGKGRELLDTMRRGSRNRVVRAMFGVLGAVGAASGGVSADSREAHDALPGAVAQVPARQMQGGINYVALPEVPKSFSPRFDATVDTFAKVYGTKPGTVFFLDRDSAIVGSVEIPSKILAMQVDKDPNVRDRFKEARLAFIRDARKKLPKKDRNSSYLLSHDKFSSVEQRSLKPHSPSENLLDACRRFFLEGLTKTKLGKTLNDAEKQRLSDLTMGLLGIESGFLTHLTSSAGARGIMQFMPSILEKYNLSGKKVTSVKFAVPKVAAYFSDMADVLLKPEGVSEIIETYGLPKTFLIYCVVQSYNTGVGNVRALARAFLKAYPTPEVFRAKFGDRINSEEVFFAMIHRLPSSALPGSFGRDGKRYVPQVCAMSERLKHVSRGGVSDLAKNASDR